MEQPGTTPYEVRNVSQHQLNQGNAEVARLLVESYVGQPGTEGVLFPDTDSGDLIPVLCEGTGGLSANAVKNALKELVEGGRISMKTTGGPDGSTRLIGVTVRQNQ